MSPLARSRPLGITAPTALAAPRRPAVAFGLPAATTSSYSLLTLAFAQLRGYTPVQISAAFLPLMLAGLCAGPLAARLAARAGTRAVLLTGLAFAGAGLVLISRMGPYPGLLPAGLLLFPIGAGMVFSAATVVAVTGAREDESGLTGGLVNTAMELGPPLGLALWAPLGHTHGYGPAFAWAAAALLVALPITALARH